MHEQGSAQALFLGEAEEQLTESLDLTTSNFQISTSSPEIYFSLS
jgi:hypothetical protein